MMKNKNIIDCYKLDIVKDIPQELTVITRHRNQLIFKNQKLKKIIWVLSTGVGCLIVYQLLKSYGNKKNKKTPK